MGAKKGKAINVEKGMKFTKYEIARMLDSRALQISMGAPFMVKLSDKDLKNEARREREIDGGPSGTRTRLLVSGS